MLRLLWRGLILTYREIFSGLMLGISAVLIIQKMSPDEVINVGLLVIFGFAAGLVKGLSKFILIEIINKIPSDNYTTNYPKYKMLSLWLAIFTIAGFANYGLNIIRWFIEPAKLVAQSFLFQNWTVMQTTVALSVVFILGIISYIYEPS